MEVTADGRTRVQLRRPATPNDNETLRQFARAVLSRASEAIGGPVSILESGDQVVRVFFDAGFWALSRS